MCCLHQHVPGTPQQHACCWCWLGEERSWCCCCCTGADEHAACRCSPRPRAHGLAWLIRHRCAGCSGLALRRVRKGFLPVGGCPELWHQEGPTASQKATEQKNPDGKLFSAASGVFGCKWTARQGSARESEGERTGARGRCSVFSSCEMRQPDMKCAGPGFCSDQFCDVEADVEAVEATSSQNTLCRVHSRPSTKCCCLLLLWPPPLEAPTSALPTSPAAAAYNASGGRW